MARQFTTVKEADFGGGIDQQAAENQIAPGFCEDLENADPKSTGHLVKRAGYQGHAGNVPVRVKSVEYNNSIIDFVLDDAISLPVGKVTPIIVHGKTSVSSGDYATETIQYYDGFTADIRKTFASGTNTQTLAQTEHLIDSPYLSVGVVASSSEVNTSNYHIFSDSIKIDTATYDIDVDYTNNSSQFQGYIYAIDKSVNAGLVYHATGQAVAPTGTTNITVLGSTHSLDNNNISALVYKENAGELELIQADSVTLNDTTGDVTVSITNNSGVGFNVTIILSVITVTNFATGSVASGAAQTIIIDSTGQSDFAFVTCYLEETIGGNLVQVIPNSIVVDSVANTITVSFVNNGPDGANFEVYWEYANVKINQLSVTATNSATFSDSDPQLTIWGLDHSEIYSAYTSRQGWVNHIDSYRISGEDRIISGLGGNLFASRTYAEIGDSYLLPSLYPRLNARLDVDTILGPVFYDTGETPNRTRGYIKADTAGNNLLEITAITYNSGTGYVEYSLDAPSLSVEGVLSTIISTTSGQEDEVTISQCGLSLHNGTFKIKAVSTGADTITISVSNPIVDSSDYDEVDVGGLAGIFTDNLTLTDTSPFLLNDILTSELFTDNANYTVTASNGSTVKVNNVTDIISVPSGLRVVGTRTSSIMPLRNLTEASVLNLVRGDMLTYTGISRQLRIRSINQLEDASISITGDGETATVTLSGETTETLFEGKTILISDTGSYNGPATVASITSNTTFTFSHDAATTESGTLVGKTIELDEDLTFSDSVTDSNVVTVAARWVPIEIPEDDYDLTEKTRTTHFSGQTYENQSTIRSTMVQDNMYLTNGEDEVLKFDGVNIYRAGLFRWQPNLFASLDNTAAGKIIALNPNITLTTEAERNASRYVVDIGDEDVFKVGDKIKDSGDGNTYTVISTNRVDAGGHAHSHITVDRQIDALGGQIGNVLIRLSVYKYYFRLNAVDLNNNIIASAATGSEDFSVSLAENASINIKLVGLPAWDIYDYDRLEVEIYRTVSNGEAPFYKIATLPMSFDNGNGYIYYTDTDTDDTLTSFDKVSTALKGAELGTAWEEPMRAKYCTSAGNRLILANLTDYPSLDLRFLRKALPVTISTLTTAGNDTWLIRKDNTDTGTTTDMTNRAIYQFTTSSVAVSALDPQNGSFNVTIPAHGLTPGTSGQWIYLFHSNSTNPINLTYSGWWQVNNVIDATRLSLLHPDSTLGAASNFPDRLSILSTPENIPVFLGNDYNYSMSNGNRLSSQSYEFLAMRRLANAINVSMRMTDTSVVTDFTPWVVANAGSEYDIGQLILRQPKVTGEFIEVEIPALTSAFDVYVNNIKRDASTSASAVINQYPSRLIGSYPNYPEIFDAPTATLDSESDSVIDVNSADGQEITAVIPFFGDAAFGSAQKSGIVVVFKTHSIYLVDFSAKAQGQVAVQKIESHGKGCTAPYSVAVTKNGIIFANESGIYKLDRGLNVTFVGRRYGRKFTENVNLNSLDIATAHHDAFSNSYKLSYPVDNETQNSLVAVYNHTREYEQQGEGSWTTYTNHPVTGWANLDADSFFGATHGRVYQVRRTGTVSDFRDDDAAILMTVLTRAMDQGESGQRKVFSQIISHFRAVARSENTALEAALDLRTEFQDTDAFVIEGPETPTGLDDSGSQKIITISSTLQDNTGIYLQLKYTNGEIDEPVEITGIDLRVGIKSDKGIKQAKSTTS